MFSLALTRERIQFWEENGYLHFQDAMPQALANDLAQWTDELARWPETPGKWMQYFEKSSSAPQGGELEGREWPLDPQKRQLCRLENFLDYHPPLKHLITHPILMDTLSQLMGDQALLFKEKINFKLPGGGAYAPHQDAPAFLSFGQTFHLTVLIPIDAATLENGCLYMVKNHHKLGLFETNSDSTIAHHVAEKMIWEPLPVARTDIVIFDSYVPHRSFANKSQAPRRTLYTTYNRAGDGGDMRRAYFDHKRKSFPPECERIVGVDYSQWESLYNVGNPIK